MGIAPPAPGTETPPAAPPAEPPVTPPATPSAAPPAEAPPAPAAPAATPPGETAEAKAARLERENTDLQTTLATIQNRNREVAERGGGMKEDELDKELERIEDLRLTDPAAAVKANGELLRKITRSASSMAQGAMTQQTIINKLRDGVKASNPDFDDDTVEYVMERADRLATTGKFKTPEEAISAAVDLVKSKFDSYAKKKNAVPPLPPGARAEGGGNPPPAPEPKDPILPTAAEEIQQRKEGQQKKIL